MTKFVTYELSGEIARIGIDDGKRNVMNERMLAGLHQALDHAEQEARAVLVAGREGIFSAGFDLQVFARRDPQEIHAMMRLGAELALRLFSFPLPVVVACTGHAYPMGAFLILASDYCVGTDGPYQIGLNEVAIGIAIPAFAIELARTTLAPHFFNRIVTGELLDPDDAQRAGYLDRLVAAADIDVVAKARAADLASHDLAAFRLTKSRVRGEATARIRRAIDDEITIENYRQLTSNKG
ncbi:crotonase/enoyl-CoA hydratase family protein [Sphingopyxis sp. GW247-27LB]|uniref:crotonase/enoyl-CoA hydratase family protein n=1 Tax=Sphingopyxis sp. GW247-27LB TaxID=2012632 RepID=UPI000BA5203D|nr:crotonase/enoyl-CoA hydratase family protein [Sphingopyxis sp. GW247-27LB]PAL19831.1 enoyl-CoA hydratase [Sphingopyxis sp. GW247-27LB]